MEKCSPKVRKRDKKQEVLQLTDVSSMGDIQYLLKDTIARYRLLF